jgi:hypothetical protein
LEDFPYEFCLENYDLIDFCDDEFKLDIIILFLFRSLSEGGNGCVLGLMAKQVLESSETLRTRLMICKEGTAEAPKPGTDVKPPDTPKP